MSVLFNFIQPILFWLFLLCIFLDGVVILARFYVKDPAMEKKRNFLLYCSLGSTMVLMFFLSLIGLQMPDNAVWNVPAWLGGLGSVILISFAFNTYSELWAQSPKRKAK